MGFLREVRARKGSLESGVWSRGLSQESGVWSLVSDVWSQVLPIVTLSKAKGPNAVLGSPFLRVLHPGQDPAPRVVPLVPATELEVIVDQNPPSEFPGGLLVQPVSQH